MLFLFSAFVALVAFASSASADLPTPSHPTASACDNDLRSNIGSEQDMRSTRTQLVNPSSLYDGTAVGMSQAKIDLESGLVFVSGQVDWSVDSQVRHTTIEGQTEGAIQNLLTVLEAANSSVNDLLQLRVYVRGELADYMETIVPILAQHLGTARPALTGIGVASLASRDTLIEIEAVAKLMEKALTKAT